MEQFALQVRQRENYQQPTDTTLPQVTPTEHMSCTASNGNFFGLHPTKFVIVEKMKTFK